MFDSEDTKNIRDLSIDDIPAYGSKAVRLGLLMREGFLVPNGFCVSTHAFNKYFESMETFKDLDKSYAVHTEDLKAFAVRQNMSSSLFSEIKDRTKPLIDVGVNSFAVRSSAAGEDSRDYSFAGLYESLLNLKTLEEIAEAIRSVWLSIWDDAAIIYRKKAYSNEEANHHLAMAVIVQEMISARFSGVCFTKNPLAKDNSCMIEFTQGTAEGLVEGDILGSRVLVDRSSLKIHSTPSESVVEENLDLQEVAKIAVQIEKVLGSPQDIEWCIDHQDRIWILQSRSITSKSKYWMPKAKINEWQLMYNEPFSTLGCELAIKRHIAWVEAISKFYFISTKPKLKLSGPLIYSKEPLSGVNWLTTRLWLRIVDIVFLVNSRHVLHTYSRESLPRYKSLLNDIQENYPLSTSLDKLADYLDKAIFIYIDSQIKSFAIGRIAQTALNVFSRYIRFGLDEKDSQDPFLYITYRNPTIQRDIALEKLILQIKNYLTSESINGLSFSRLRRILQKDMEGRQHLKRLETFLERNRYLWADRYPRDPGWELDEKRLNSTIEKMLQYSDKETLTVSINKRINESKRALKEIETDLTQLTFGRLRLVILKLLLSKVNCLAAYKDQRNLFLYSLNMTIRMVALEIGRRLVEEGELLSQNDIFYLKQNEISKICSGELSWIYYREKMEKRKDSFSKIKANGIPKTSKSSFPGRSQIRTSNSFYGTGCSPGLAEGKARIILNGDDLSSLKQGEIAVCYHFRPAWSIILGLTAGLVVEEANLLSHGAILAREYGVPTVVNIPGIVEALDTGNIIKIDGSSGLAKLLTI